MPKSLETGKHGEEQAVAFLKAQGFEILHTNWRYKNLELDIVAREGEFLAVIEVKTRKNADFGAPEIFVDRKKQKKLIRAANEYIKQLQPAEEVRFDIVAVNNATGAVELIRRAFYPDLF